MLFSLLWFVSTGAVAAPVPISHQASVDLVINDDFRQRRGLRYDLRFDLAPTLSVGAGFSWFRQRPTPFWGPSLPPWITGPVQPQLLGTFHAEIVPVRTELPGGLSSELRARLGVGVVRTEEDLESYAADGLIDWEATKGQVHPALEVGLAGRVRRGDLFVEGGARQLSFVEVIGGTNISLQRHLFVDLGIGWVR